MHEHYWQSMHYWVSEMSLICAESIITKLGETCVENNSLVLPKHVVGVGDIDLTEYDKAISVRLHFTGEDDYVKVVKFSEAVKYDVLNMFELPYDRGVRYITICSMDATTAYIINNLQLYKLGQRDAEFKDVKFAVHTMQMRSKLQDMGFYDLDLRYGFMRHDLRFSSLNDSRVESESFIHYLDSDFKDFLVEYLFTVGNVKYTNVIDFCIQSSCFLYKDGILFLAGRDLERDRDIDYIYGRFLNKTAESQFLKLLLINC